MNIPADSCESRVIHEEKIQRARAGSLKAWEINRLSGLFKAMGDPTRLRILWALELGEMCVCDIAALLGITESAVSHQLRTLRQLELVANRRDGTVLYYRLNDEHVSQLTAVALEHVREGDSIHLR
jgi:DNA-binding transcriptional ArsR family regulator